MKKYELQGETDFQGLKIAIENRKGSVRSGVDMNGEAWKTKLTADYGYVRKTEGTDGDEVDVFIGENVESSKVFIIHTHKIPKQESTTRINVFWDTITNSKPEMYSIKIMIPALISKT